MTSKNDAARAAAAIDRRTLVKGLAATGALALAAPLGGCAVLGIENPYADVREEEPTPGVTDFAKLHFAMDLDRSTWHWEKVDDPASPHNGSLVLGVPVTATNNDTASRVLSNLYCKVVAPDGVEQPDISGWYASSDILRAGSIPAGKTVSGLLHILYRGAGAYTVKFDNLLGRKVNLVVELGGHEACGLRPIPAQLGAADVEAAVVYGTPFQVNGLTLTFSADESNYWWTTASDPSNPAWNGRWCVGVPLTIENCGTAPAALTADMYGLFAPELYRLDDPAPWFPTASAAHLGAIPAGGAIQSAMFWVYMTDGWYYAAFDDGGKKVVAAVRISQY